jgi:hypothetical protein
MLALSLLKRSPNSYSLLRVLLPLPSRHTLQSILGTVHFAAGINARVFGALQHSLQKMSDRDRYCCLLFDEMSIRENVCFNQTLDCIYMCSHYLFASIYAASFYARNLRNVTLA